MTAHRLLLSAMHSNDDIDWPVHSLMLFFHDLRDLPVRPPSSSIHCSICIAPSATNPAEFRVRDCFAHIQDKCHQPAVSLWLCSSRSRFLRRGCVRPTNIVSLLRTQSQFGPDLTVFWLGSNNSGLCNFLSVVSGK